MQSWPSSDGGPRLARYRSRLAPTHLNVFDRYFLPSCLLLASPPPRSDTPKSQPLMTFPLVARRSTFDLLSPEHQASIHRKWSSYSTHRESPTSSILAPSRLRLPSHRTERRLTQVTYRPTWIRRDRDSQIQLLLSPEHLLLQPCPLETAHSVSKIGSSHSKSRWARQTSRLARLATMDFAR